MINKSSDFLLFLYYFADTGYLAVEHAFSSSFLIDFGF